MCADPVGNLAEALASAVRAAEHSAIRARQWAELIADAGRDADQPALLRWGQYLQTGIRDDDLTGYLTYLINATVLNDGALIIALEERGVGYRLAKRYDEALADFNRAIELDPSNRPIHGLEFAQREGTDEELRGAIENLRRRDRAIEEIQVYIYLDTDDEQKINQIVGYTDQLVELLGFAGPIDTKVERGSFIRGSKAKIKNGLTSAEMKEKLASLERIIELYGLDVKQAQVDAQFAGVIVGLLAALKDLPNACIRAGSTLILKYEADGRPVVLSRQLTSLEIRALEKYPEVQKVPSNTIAALAMAVEKLEGDTPAA